MVWTLPSYRMMLGTYQLQDPNGRQLASLVLGNSLIKATINSAEDLQKLWALLAMKDQLRRRNLFPELVLSNDTHNTDIIEQYMLQDDDISEADTSAVKHPSELTRPPPNVNPDLPSQEIDPKPLCIKTRFQSPTQDSNIL